MCDRPDQTQHHHMMHTSKVYERSTLYKRMGVDNPQYLVIHEYCAAELPQEIPDDKLNVLDDNNQDTNASEKIRIADKANWKYLSEHRTHDSLDF